MLATGGWSEARVVQLPAQEVSARSVGLTLQLVTKQPSAEDNATVMNKSIQWVAVPTALSGEPFISTPRPEQSVSRALLTLSEIVKLISAARDIINNFNKHPQMLGSAHLCRDLW